MCRYDLEVVVYGFLAPQVTHERFCSSGKTDLHSVSTLIMLVAVDTLLTGKIAVTSLSYLSSFALVASGLEVIKNSVFSDLLTSYGVSLAFICTI